jgi:hypothetical protein
LALGKAASLPIVFLALGKEGLCRVFFFCTRQNSFFAKCFFSSVFYLALGKEFLCRVPEKKHSANHVALGEEPDSSSDGRRRRPKIATKSSQFCT